jgi:hypothetical protein
MNNDDGSLHVGFIGLLTIVFITLKLCNVIQWSWIWVLSPIWITPLFIIVVVIGLAIIHKYFSIH